MRRMRSVFGELFFWGGFTITSCTRPSQSEVWFETTSKPRRKQTTGKADNVESRHRKSNQHLATKFLVTLLPQIWLCNNSSTVSGKLFHQNELEEEDESDGLGEFDEDMEIFAPEETETLKFHHGGRQISLYPTETDLSLAHVESIRYAESRSKGFFFWFFFCLFILACDLSRSWRRTC